MSTTVAFIIGLIILLVLLLKTRINAFISIMIAAVFIGVASGLGGVETMDAVKDGFASTCGSVGIVIIMGTMLGSYLEESGAAKQLAETILSWVGEKRASLAMAISGYIVSIPVFVDVAYVMLAPLYKSIHRRSKKIPIGSLATALAIGLLTTNSMVPPTPGPIAVAGLLNLDLGRAIMYGLLVSAIMTIAGWAYCEFFLAKKPDDWYTYQEGVAINEAEIEEEEEETKTLPNFFISILPILIPIILIMLNTTFKATLGEGHVLVSLFAFLGNSNFAISVGVFSAIVLLMKYMNKEAIFRIMNTSLNSCGMIIFITAAGGALAKVIGETGIDKQIADTLIGSGLPLVLIPFLISGFSKFVQGSGSVAMIMSATLCAPLATAGYIDPVLIFLSACVGSNFGSQINNSFFWVFANINGYDTKTGIKTLCAGQLIISIVGIGVTMILSMFM